MQDSLKAGLEASVIPAFEMSCKAMFDQVDAAFQRGMVEHTAAAQQHFEAAHSSLALTLRVCILVLHYEIHYNTALFINLFKTKMSGFCWTRVVRLDSYALNNYIFALTTSKCFKQPAKLVYS